MGPQPDAAETRPVQAPDDDGPPSPPSASSDVPKGVDLHSSPAPATLADVANVAADIEDLREEVRTIGRRGTPTPAAAPPSAPSSGPRRPSLPTVAALAVLGLLVAVVVAARRGIVHPDLLDRR